MWSQKMGKSLPVFPQKCMSLMYGAASVLKRGWMNGDERTQTLVPNPSLITVCTTQGWFSVLGLRGLCCSGMPRSELPCTLHQALHPETGQLRAKSCRAGVAGGLLCGHLKHRASLSLKGKRQWHGKGLRS